VTKHELWRTRLKVYGLFIVAIALVAFSMRPGTAPAAQALLLLAALAADVAALLTWKRRGPKARP